MYKVSRRSSASKEKYITRANQTPLLTKGINKYILLDRDQEIGFLIVDPIEIKRSIMNNRIFKKTQT